ncbi:MFS transporter [Thalassospira aquimaris]|uniref:MFS transporter n=1 Tax=Thalassospira aquimaris TaxID=3037796 RepID=A0ABT6GBH0_9PROT|nr:MFS transporter [Thalassospira sp. FZY0004]MDG4719408.1 MFS transporter [Thalassospira sp. FZY0004]
MSDLQSGTPPTQTQPQAPRQAPAAWAAVISMTLGVFGLVTAEFLPVSLLTPMAADLQVSEGLAGQAISATAFLALITSLLIATLTRRFDRRNVLLSFSVLLVISSIIVATADNFAFLLLGRVLLGIALGGFWTMSAATIMRLVPENHVPRALAIMFSGVSAATVFAAPVGSFLGDIISWRAVFLLAAGIGVITFIVQFATLPSLPPRGRASLRTLVDLINRPGMKFGLFSLVIIITGHFALFTYVRPFLENVTGVATAGVSGVLLGFGIANFIGTHLAGALIACSLRMTIALMPLIMGLATLGMVMINGALNPTIVLVAIWGMAFGGVPVAWSTWITRTVPDEAESGGGLVVAGFQTAIASGAVIGGLVVDHVGALGVFSLGGIVLVISAVVVTAVLRPAPTVSEQA